MNRKNMNRVMMFALVLTFGSTAAYGPAALAERAFDAKHLVETSKLTFDTFAASKDLESFRSLLKKAKGVFISPQVLQGAFVFGVSGGSGVFVARDSEGENWNGPAFYTIGEASFGFQAGGQASQVVMLAMTDRGVAALLSASVKLGADVGIAAGPVGVGASAATANISADIVTYSLAKGLYGGVSLTGAVVAVRKAWNEAYYNKPGVTPTDILIRREVSAPHSNQLVQAVTLAASGTESTHTYLYHTVEKGDTLSEISGKYGVSVAELSRLNNISEEQHIFPGQKILLAPSN